VRVAVLNDIHGNLPALDAVLQELREAIVDRIVVGGDVFPGPMPHLVLRTLLACGIPVDFIYGNGEVAMLEQLAGKVPTLLPESYRPHVRWNAEQLERSEQQRIADWPLTRRLAMPFLGEVLFCHATPRNENEIFTPLTAEDRLLPIFGAANADVVVCGHTHVQFDRRIGSTRVVNAGSVGMPFGPPGADWLLMDSAIELHHTSYDLEAAAERIRASGYPGAEEFAAKYVLHPPTTDDMLALYSRHELKG
jgi:predicted phosphodiesterase